MSLSNLCLVFACVLLLSGVYAKQATPFSPIHPGTIHADHFSPLQGDGVYVDHFAAHDFSSFKLDFASLNSATPVEFDLAGGVKFNNDNFAITTEGEIIVESEVNNLNLEALSGHALFEADNFLAASYGSDITFESVNGNLDVETFRGDLTLSGAGISVEGNFRDGGVSLTSEGVMDFVTSPSYYNFGSESIDFSGRSIMANGNGITAEGDEDMYFYAMNKLDIDSDGPMNLGSTELFEVLSLSGTMSVEAAQMNVQAPDFVYEATGSMTMASVLGNVALTGSSSIDVKSADQVKFTSNEMGIYASAGGDITMTAGDSIDFASSSADPTSAWMVSDRFILDSTLDSVDVHAKASLTLTATDEIQMNANSDAYITSQNNFSVSSTGSIVHDIDRNIMMSSGNMMTFNGGNGNLEITIDDDMYVVTEDLYSIKASGIVFNIEDDIDMEIQSDFFITSDGFDITYDNNGSISGDFEVEMLSSGDVNINADDIDFFSGHSVNFISAGDASFTVSDDVIITAPIASRFESESFTFTGTSDLSVNSIGGINFDFDLSFILNAGSDIEFSSALDYTHIGNDWNIFAGTDVELVSGRDFHMIAQDEISFISQGFSAVSNIVLDAGDNLSFTAGSFFAEGDNLNIDTNDWFIYSRSEASFSADQDFVLSVIQELTLGAQDTVTVNAGDLLSFDADNNMLIDSTILYYGDISFTTATGNIDLEITDDFDVQNTGRIESHAGADFSMSATDTISISHRDDPIDFGNVIFSVGGIFDASVDFYNVDARTAELYALDTMTLSTLEDFTFQTFNGNSLTFDAGHNILISTNSFSLGSPVNDIIADEFATISTSAIDGIAISSSSFYAASVEGTTISADTSMDYTYNSFVWNALMSLTATIGDLDVNAGDLSMIAHGSGNTMMATGLISIDALNVDSTTGRDLGFKTTSGKTDLSATVNFASSGGAHTISSVLDSTWTSAGEVEIRTNDNGFLKFISGGSILSTTTNEFRLSGFQSDLTEEEGRYGTIKTTAADGHICIHNTDSDSLNFFGDSVEWNAYGPEATLTAESIGAMDFLSDIGSIGMTAFGWVPTDPQFHFEPEVTFGILYRTADGNTNGISVSGEDLSAHAGQDILISALTSTVDVTTTENIDFRTYAQNADIVVDVTDGDVSVVYEDGGFITAGNPLLPADLSLAATKDINIIGTGALEFAHLGTTTDLENNGILLEAFDDMTYTAATDIEFNANDGGFISLETRGGDMSFTSTNGFNEMTAETGSINMIVRGDATFDAAAAIDIAADGDGGSVRLSSGGEQLFSVIATDDRFFVTAEQGEIDFEATTGFDVIAAVDTIIDGRAVNIEGGSVLFNAVTSLDFRADEEITMDANIQFTIDSEIINFTSGEGIDLSAGGNGVTSGITATSVGDISYDSSADEVSLNALRVFVTAAEDTLFTVENDVIVRSRAGSALDNAITLTAQVGNSLILADKFTAKAVENTLSSNDVTLTARNMQVISQSGDIDISTAGQWSYDGASDANFYGSNMDILIGADLNLVSLTGDIDFVGEASTTFSGTGTLTSLSDSFVVAAIRGSFTTESVGSTTLTMTGDFIASSGGETEIMSPSSVILQTTAGPFTLDSRDDLISYSRNDVEFIANTGSFDSFSFEVFTNNFVADDQVNLSLSAVHFNAYAYEDFEVDAANINIIGVDRQNFDFHADGKQFYSAAATLAINSLDDIVFSTSSNDDNGIDIDTTLTNIAGNLIEMRSKRDVLISGGPAIYNIATSFDVSSFGHDGIVFDADTLVMTNTDTASFTSSSGNVEIYATNGGSMDVDTATTLSFTSTHNYGDIRVSGGNTLDMVSSNDFTISQYNPARTHDSNRSGRGIVEIEASTLDLSSPSALTFNSDSDFIHTSRSSGASSFAGQTVDIFGGHVLHFDTYDGMNIAAASATINAAGSLSGEIYTASNTVNFVAGNTMQVFADSIMYKSSGYIETFSGATGTTFTSVDNNIVANRGDIVIDASNTIGFNPTDDLRVSATGTEGVLAIDSVGATFILSDLSFTAADSIHWPVTSFLVDDFDIYSGGDLVFDAPIININVDDTLEFATSYDGGFRMNSNSISVTATNSDLRLFARGMLGTIGGRYVLEDNYWLPYTTFDEHHRINRNTNGIEVNNVNGDVIVQVDDDIDIISVFGSVEFKPADTMRYLVPNTGEIWFFGINSAEFLNPGRFRNVPFTFSTNYCNTPGGCNHQAGCPGSNSDPCPPPATCVVNCIELSSVVNDIVSAMVAYGLLNCNVAGGFCF